jgi:acyl carrier protein
MDGLIEKPGLTRMGRPATFEITGKGRPKGWSIPDRLGRHRDREVEMQEIRQTVHAYILGHFLPGEDPADLTDQTPLITGGILDSIRTLKLVVFLEDTFGVTVEAHEAGVDNLDSVGQIARLIEKKKSAA